MKLIPLICALGVLTLSAVAQKKLTIYVPLAQPEIAHNLVNECPTLNVTWIPEKADFALSWGLSEDRSTEHWVVYNSEALAVAAGDAKRISASARDICKAIIKP